MDRQHRHQLKHDKFVDNVGVLSSRARENQRLLIVVAGGLLVAAAIVYGVFTYRSSRETQAQLMLGTAIETYDAPIRGEQQQTQAESGPSFKTEQERTAASEKQFKDVQQKYSGTDAADVAGLYLGQIAVSRGDTATARGLFQKFIGDHSDNILVSTARFSLYQLRIGNGEAVQVTAELNAELAKPTPVLPGDAILVLLAQAYEQQGNAAKSKEAYRRITTEYPDSAYVVEAQRRAGAA